MSVNMVILAAGIILLIILGRLGRSRKRKGKRNFLPIDKQGRKALGLKF
jgi:hypothetical protein